MKSKTCRGANDQFLTEYHTHFAAETAAGELLELGGQKLASYKCQYCGYWHLTGASVRRQCQFCTDSQLFLKDIYPTISEAQKTAEHLLRSKKLKLYPYRCKHGSGWHLTKSKPK